MDKLVLREAYGSSTMRKEYHQLSDGSLNIIDKSPKFTSLSHFFRSVFLPQGYPESVSDDYLTYQIWDTIQAFASSITGSLAAQAMLKGIGVGDKSATVLAATLTWLLKDGTGMLGRIVFAWLKGTSLDCEAKRWRLFADILNDFAIFLEILAPKFPSVFTAVVCSAGVCKSIVGVAGGATRAALTQHQARRNNMADVSAKDGSQETLVNLAALICNLILIPLVTGKEEIIWTLYILFTVLHLFANYSAVTCVVMETLNQGRLHLLVGHYLREGRVEGTRKINGQESVLRGTRRCFSLNLGTSINKICKSSEDVSSLLDIYEPRNYLLGIDIIQRKINIVLHKDSDTLDQIQVCYQAEVIETVFKHVDTLGDNHQLGGLISAVSKGDCKEILKESHIFTIKTFDSFVKNLESENWNTKISLLCADEWRGEWSSSGLSDKRD